MGLFKVWREVLCQIKSVNLDTLDLVEDQRNKGSICCFKLTDSVEVTDYDSPRMYELAHNKEKLLKAWNKVRQLTL